MCPGASPTGAQLAYDAERRLSHWQNAPTNPTSQAWYLYDGAGQRVEQYVSGGSGNHTYYLPGNVEEVTPSGSLIKYYTAGGMALGVNTASDASGISYLASDGLGSVSEALNGSGTATGAQLYSPYGGVRYTTGTMPTSKGFTGQYADTSNGQDYYRARYYDPSLGQFTSADTVADGMNRYGYVTGNPETFTDPTGHRIACQDGGCVVEQLNTAITVAQTVVGAGAAMRRATPQYRRWARNTAWGDYTDAKNAADAAQHAAGKYGKITKAQLRKLADDRNQAASDADSTADAVDGALGWTRKAGKGLLLFGILADIGLSAYDQWNQDASGQYSQTQRVARAATAGVVHAGLDAAVGVGVAAAIQWGFTALVGAVFIETGPADPFIAAGAYALAGFVAPTIGAAVASNLAAPVINGISDAAANWVGSWFS